MLAATPFDDSAMLRMVASASSTTCPPRCAASAAFCDESAALAELLCTC